MTRALVIADSGRVMAALTGSLCAMRDVQIVRHVNGRTPIEPLVRSAAPELVIVDEMRWATLALTRIAEIRRGAPAAAVVVSYSWPEADWLADALRAGASAVLPAEADDVTFGMVVREALAGVARIAPHRSPAGSGLARRPAHDLAARRRGRTSSSVIGLAAAARPTGIGDFEPPPRGNAA